MFSMLNSAFEKAFKKVSGRGTLRESDVQEIAREIKLALLSADVHFSVVKDFVDGVVAKSLGQDVLDSITPAQQFTKIVHDELIRVLGGMQAEFDFSAKPPLIVMMVGLQGSGKTTTAARFALRCKKLNRRVLLVPADIHRPAAIDQLKALAAKAEIDCYPSDAKDKAVKIAKEAVKLAEKNGYDTVIIDTAGRLHIDEEMMDEVKGIANKVDVQRILYVADSMTGQDAVRSAKAFDEALAITGVVLTKIDGDARGGAALSIRATTGKPIIFVGSGEGIEDLEPFHPDRMASRILGRGDVISLVERVSESVDMAEAQDLGQSLSKGEMSFDDFLKQMRMMKKLGPLDRIMGMLPGMGNIMKNVNTGELDGMLARREAMVHSMTREERSNPRILNGSRRKRIATGSGVEVSELNRFLKEFEQMSAMMKKFMKMGSVKGVKNLLKGLT